MTLTKRFGCGGAGKRRRSSIDRVGSHGDTHRDGVFERFTSQFGDAGTPPRVVDASAATTTGANCRHLLESTCRHRPHVRHGRLAACRARRTQLLLLLLYGTVLARGGRVHQGRRRTAAGRRYGRRAAVARDQPGGGSHLPG